MLIFFLLTRSVCLGTRIFDRNNVHLTDGDERLSRGSVGDESLCISWGLVEYLLG